MIIQSERFQSSLSIEEVLTIAKERLPDFQKLPGLIDKYYTQTADHQSIAGIYIWDSEESMLAVKDTELAKTIPVAYKVKAPPEIETCEVVFSLRE